jgi:hypothetical protein
MSSRLALQVTPGLLVLVACAISCHGDRSTNSASRGASGSAGESGARSAQGRGGSSDPAGAGGATQNISGHSGQSDESEGGAGGAAGAGGASEGGQPQDVPPFTLRVRNLSNGPRYLVDVRHWPSVPSGSDQLWAKPSGEQCDPRISEPVWNEQTWGGILGLAAGAEYVDHWSGHLFRSGGAAGCLQVEDAPEGEYQISFSVGLRLVDYGDPVPWCGETFCPGDTENERLDGPTTVAEKTFLWPEEKEVVIDLE